MSNRLQGLLKTARKVKMTNEEKERQRRSFAYGNTKIENQRITKAHVDRAAQELAREKA